VSSDTTEANSEEESDYDHGDNNTQFQTPFHRGRLELINRRVPIWFPMPDSVT
jgi:hypothetical protein